jgi:hypothetical protein
MLDQSDDFVKASGALAAICYREDMELALRTPGFGGFQLLDIMDFPGQGTALVGMLNVFMESKGLIDPATWRESCAAIVPLIRMEKHTWTRDETLSGEIEIAHYGEKDLTDAVVTSTISSSSGDQVVRLQAMTLQAGGLRPVGKVALPLHTNLKVPEKMTLTIAIEGTPYRNQYPIWVYPSKADTSVPAGVIVSRNLSDAKTQTHLAAGGKVLLLPQLDQLPQSVLGGFQTEFWSPMFAQSAKKRGLEEPPGTLGLLCDPAHPALAAFPTEFHSNWQWWHLVKNSRPIVLDGTPANYRPIVQVIDNFDRNHKLGLLFETQVGKGSVLICPIDLPAIQDQPEARQFLHSLLKYAASENFAPKHELDPTLLKALLPE